MLRSRGSARHCPCCGSDWKRFSDFNGRDDALCLRCGSLERHRFLAGLLGDLKAVGPAQVLHIAPEPSLRRLLTDRFGDGYLSSDIDPEGVDLAADAASLPLPDSSFGLILCSHVLEHVPDDRAVIRELARVAAPGAPIVLMFPIDAELAETIEDPGETDPARRLERFGQDDHVRMYGRDAAARIASAGVAVQERSAADELTAAQLSRLSIPPSERAFVATSLDRSGTV